VRSTTEVCGSDNEGLGIEVYGEDLRKVGVIYLAGQTGVNGWLESLGGGKS
jgi:hypothetical protein